MAAKPTVEEAYALLYRLGAPPRLVSHAQVVGAVARDLLPVFLSFGVNLDENLVRVGAVLHDAGKLVHPEELDGPGHLHECAGKRLLLEAGLPEAFAAMCVWHANWMEPDLTLEYLVVALADKLWKGKREPELETLVVRSVSQATGSTQWEVFDRLDTIFEEAASKGDRRLLESQDFSVRP